MLPIFAGIVFLSTIFNGVYAKEKYMSKEIYVYAYETPNRAPYDFMVGSDILGSFNTSVFGNLLTMTMEHEIRPGLIKSWSYDFKTKTFSFQLGDHRFHNGRKVTAKDVEFSILRGFISETHNYNSIHFASVKGLESLSPGMKYKSGMASGIRVTGENTLEIELKEANPIFLSNFAVPFAPLVPMEELKDDYYTWKRHPIGAGPYKIKTDYKDERTTLEVVHPNSRQADIIHFDSVRKRDHYDLLLRSQLKKKSEENFKELFSTHPVSILTFQFYRLNPLARDKNFRKFIYHGIDREKLVAGVSHLRPAYQMMAAPYGGRNPAENPYQPELAKSYLAKVIQKIRNKELRISVFGSKTIPPTTITRIERLKALLEPYGLKLVFEPNEDKFPTNEAAEKYPMIFTSKVIDLADPVVSYGVYATGSPYYDNNPSESIEYDKVYRKAVEMADPHERLAEVQKLAKIIEKEAIVVPLAEEYAVYALNPEKIKTLGEQPYPLFLDFSKIELK